VSDTRTKLNPHVPPFGQLPVGVIGCGRMGRLHAKFYGQMPQVRLVGVYDSNPESAAAVADEFRTKPFNKIEDFLAEVAAATIAVPTVVHPEYARKCIDAGVACLIEKPLAKDVADAEQIVGWERAGNVTVQVGHIERFNPAIRAMRAMDVRPGFIEVTRISPLTFRSIDVGVVLDMMIHDIDIVLQLAQSEVARIDATGVSITGEAEDICNARIVFKNGCVANMTASRLALKTERKLRVFSPDAYVSVDYQKRYGIVAHRTGNVDAIRDAVSRIRSGEIQDLADLNFADLVNIKELQIDDSDPLRAELESFVNAVKNRIPAEVPAEDGLAAVVLATQIVKSIAPQRLA
jgi:predicted dehydrogenase